MFSVDFSCMFYTACILPGAWFWRRRSYFWNQPQHDELSARCCQTSSTWLCGTCEKNFFWERVVPWWVLRWNGHRDHLCCCHLPSSRRRTWPFSSNSHSFLHRMCPMEAADHPEGPWGSGWQDQVQFDFQDRWPGFKTRTDDLRYCRQGHWMWRYFNIELDSTWCHGLQGQERIQLCAFD